MALEVNLGTLWNEALAALLATVLDDAATSFVRHACTETVLLLASALGRLISHFHGRKKSKVEKLIPAQVSGTRRLAVETGLSTNRGIFLKIELRSATIDRRGMSGGQKIPLRDTQNGIE